MLTCFPEISTQYDLQRVGHNINNTTTDIKVSSYVHSFLFISTSEYLSTWQKNLRPSQPAFCTTFKTPKGTLLLLLFNLQDSLNFIISGLAPNLLKEPMLSNAFLTPLLPVHLSQPFSLLKVTKTFTVMSSSQKQLDAAGFICKFSTDY